MGKDREGISGLIYNLQCAIFDVVESNLVMYEDEFRRIDEELKRLYQQADAKVLFLIDKKGQGKKRRQVGRISFCGNQR